MGGVPGLRPGLHPLLQSTDDLVGDAAVDVLPLLGRVEEADPRKREVSLPTMQRFVRGSVKTSDMVVGMCLQFLKAQDFAVPEAPDDPLSGFETELSGFLLPPDLAGDEPERMKEMAGRYQAEQGWPTVVSELAVSPDLISASLLSSIAAPSPKGCTERWPEARRSAAASA